jgi:sarcosine oxidase subunit alpha
MSRLSSGGLIDRSRVVSFSFDGKAYTGLDGDTLASALLANDVALVGRSFKYHRPRGTVTAGPEEPSALVTLGAGDRTEPNIAATCVELRHGLEAASQNRWPSLGLDLLAVNGLFSPLFAAGFYYKSFMWPAALWERLYEPAIRRAAGLGALSGKPDPDLYDAGHLFCDLLVIGAGPAGLSAALAAGRAGARVVLVESDWRLGGRLLSERREIGGAPALDWVEASESELLSLPRVRVLRRTGLFGAYDGGVFGAVEHLTDQLAQPRPGSARQRMWKILARRAVLAAGAVERPIAFGGNDRPGVMSAAAVQTYVNRFAVAPGRRIAVFAASDSGRAVVQDLTAAGVEMPALIDPARGEVVSATFGGRRLRAIEVRDAAGRTRRVEADVLAVAGGWNPSVGIGCHLDARPEWSPAIQAFLLPRPSAGMILAGAAAGRFGLGAALADGAAAGAAIAGELGFSTLVGPAPVANDEPATATPCSRVANSRGKVFVDLQHDVTDADIFQAAREGFVSVEHLKRYTTLGMATDQGKTGQIVGHALLAEATGRTIAEVGTIRPRPPWTPVAIGVLAGLHRDEHLAPTRLTAGHEWAAEQGARFVDAGLWKRARWFARPGEREGLAIASREASAVRRSVGICDVSTLGKIELHGPDVGILLDWLYVNTMSTLAPRRARYGVMLREDGFVLDDGTVTRLDELRWVITTTTANAERVVQHLDYACQIQHAELDVQAASVTEQWATYAVAGPRSRALLERLLPSEDLSNTAMPYMAARELSWRDVPARLFRLSFSGELAYEIAVPAYAGDALPRSLMASGETLEVVPYGLEAMSVLRIEKGHAASGELNGQVTASDLGLGRMMSTRKDYVGRAMAQRPGLVDPERPVLVGLKALDGSQLLAGAHLLAVGADSVAANDLGHVSSVAYSPTVQAWIGLAFLKRGRERYGERLRARDLLRAGDAAVEICDPVFVDPEGVRLRG